MHPDETMAERLSLASDCVTRLVASHHDVIDQIRRAKSRPNCVPCEQKAHMMIDHHAALVNTASFTLDDALTDTIGWV